METSRKTLVQARLRKIHMESSRKGRKISQGPWPWEESQRKREITWAEILPREWVVQPATGHTSPGVLHREDKPHRLVGELVGLTEGLWEAWTLLFRNTCTLTCFWNSEEKENWKLHEGLASVPRLPLGSCSSLSLRIAPALLGSRCSSTFTFSTLFSFFSFWDPYKVSLGTLDVVPEIP